MRDVNGYLVSHDIAKALEVSENPHQWEQDVAFDAKLTRLQSQRSRIVTAGNKMQDARDRANAGESTGEELDKRLAEFEDLLATEERTYAAGLDNTPNSLNRTASGLVADVSPTDEFSRASLGDLPDLVVEEELTLPVPSASTPAPG